ncbi:MAG: cysteine synthase family protein [Planctomycetes bacterium]|nr:cysteine synthase family protein [Planctomycetota bacterium]
MSRIASDVTWLVGRTPLVELARVSPPGSRIVGKLEAWNPTGSNKDRAALGMIRHAERSGFLRPGGTVVECSSGDLGIATATMGRRLGYRVVLTMPDDVPEVRRNVLLALGAEVVTTPRHEGMRGAMVRAETIVKQTPGALCLQAFTNRANVRAHAETTAREIWEDTDGEVKLVVAPVGTGGTAAGCVAFFTELGVAVAGVQPAQSAVLTGGAPGHHGIPGLGAGFVPDILVPGDLAAIVDVGDDDAIAGVRNLASRESLLLGPASGAVLHAAQTLARLPRWAGALIVAILPDSGERYRDHAGLGGEGAE